MEDMSLIMQKNLLNLDIKDLESKNQSYEI